VWAKDLWNRLNGTPGQPLDKDAPYGLPLPLSTDEQRKQHMQQLNLQLDSLEKKLQVGGQEGGCPAGFLSLREAVLWY